MKLDTGLMDDRPFVPMSESLDEKVAGEGGIMGCVPFDTVTLQIFRELA